jgi:phospholipase C
MSAASAATQAIPGVNHIVVIYEENHSFDNLYGLWGDVNGQHVNGLADATIAQKTQIAQSGSPYGCLLQLDVNLDTTNGSKYGTTTVAGSQAPACANQTGSNTYPGSTGSPGQVALPYSSAMANQPFSIGSYIPASAATCPAPGVFAPLGLAAGSAGALPGGCTRDIVHRFYQEQYQIDAGKQDRYTQGSDAAGLTQGYYDTTQLPIWQYLHGAGSYAGTTAPNYAVDDNFFQGGFGGSFLNHQVLVAGQAPLWPGGADKSGVQTGCSTGSASCDLHSVVDSNGFPNSSYPLYKPVGNATVTNPTVKDNQLTEAADASGSCAPSYTGAPPAPAGTLCGDYAINTIQPFTQPYAPGTVVGKRLPNLTSDNIGDEMTKAGVDWGWYSGGYDNAAGFNGFDANHPQRPGWTAGATGPTAGPGTTNSCQPTPGSAVASGAAFPYCADAVFQFHHQALGYYANYADGTPGRVNHLFDEHDLMKETDASGADLPAYSFQPGSTLKPVTFIKPIGEQNEHPGYTSESAGSTHLVKMIQALAGPTNPDAAHTMVVVTYDEFGGAWDHVSPPGAPGNLAPHDAFGPGTRVPTLIVSPALSQSGVDHTSHDTVSILTTIENQFGVGRVTQPNGTPTRDAAVADLSSAFTPAANVPEAPWLGLLPLSAVVVGGGVLWMKRRRRTVSTPA